MRRFCEAQSSRAAGYFQALNQQPRWREPAQIKAVALRNKSFLCMQGQLSPIWGFKYYQ